MNTVDLNIKSFLLDMRNKSHQQQNIGTGFISVIDEQTELS